MIEDWR